MTILASPKIIFDWGLLFAGAAAFSIYNFYGNEPLDVARYAFLVILILCILFVLYYLVILNVLPVMWEANGNMSKMSFMLIGFELLTVVYLIASGYWFYTLGQFAHGSSMDSTTNILAQVSMYTSTAITLFYYIVSGILADDWKMRMKYIPLRKPHEL